jgi:hypothetical protein
MIGDGGELVVKAATRLLWLVVIALALLVWLAP